MKKIFILLLLVIFANQCVAAYAAANGEIERKGSDILMRGATETMENDYDRREFNKISRGVFNVITAVFELPFTVYEVSKKQNPVAGFFYGIPMGIGRAFFRLTVGIVEIFTFPYEPFEPMIEPEYLLIKNKKTD